MQQGSGIILILVGFLVMYIVVTGKYPVFEKFFYELFNLTPAPIKADGSVSGTIGSKTGVSGQAKIIQDAIDSARRSVITGGASGSIVIP